MQRIEVPGSGPADAQNDAETASPPPERLPRHRSPEAMRLVRRGKTPAGAAPAPAGERAPLPNAPAPPPLADDPPSTFCNGIRIPAGAVAYRVARYEDGKTKKVKEYCTLTPPGTTEAVEYFPLAMPAEASQIPPGWSNVLKLWGSGFYAYQFSGPNKEWMGWSDRKRLDDARFPPMPAHRSLADVAPPAPAAPPPSPVPTLPIDPMAAIVSALAASGGGKIDASVAIALVMMSNQMNHGQLAALEERQRRWRQEDEDRARQREVEHRQRLEHERQMAIADLQRVESFYTSARQREASSESDERMRRLEEQLEGVLDALDDQAEPAPAEKSITDQAIEQFLPVVAARFGSALAAPPPAPPEGDKS